LAAILSTIVCMSAPESKGQNWNGGWNNRGVGGISINADGLLENATPDALGALVRLRREVMQRVPADLKEAVPLRKISLRCLEAALDQCLKAGKLVPDELFYLGGLQEVRYVFAYPEQKDIVLVGPAEGWKVDGRGNVVGTTTGKPVILLDDLLVALRTAQSSARAGITCSIDPTKEGLQQLRAHVAGLKTIGNPAATGAGIEEALGKQQITFTGVPATSHFAQVLVGADYRMKRIAMGFEPSPLGKTLPSFLTMLTASGSGMSNMLPRWWLEPRYESLLRDADGVAWEFRGSSVQCMTEEDFLSTAGARQHTGKSGGTAQRWADKMTAHYGELAVAEPIFGELRNCMELAVVGALVARENLIEKAGCSLPVLMGSSALKPMELPAPSQVDSKVSMLKKGRNWIISASGGVAINANGVLEKVRKSDAPVAVRAKATPTASAKWCWD
jgi:hypothetical protein